MAIIKAKPTVANTNITLANTEYSYQLPAGTREYWIRLRNPGYILKVAEVSGNSGTTYYTVQAGETAKTIDIKSSNVTLYFQSPQAGMVAEIISFK